MKFLLLDIVAAFMVLAITFGCSFSVGYFIYEYLSMNNSLFLEILVMGSFFLTFQIISFFLLKVIRIYCPLEEGRFSLSNSKQGFFWKLQGFLYIFNIGILLNTYLVPINLRAYFYNILGSKISPLVMIGGKILEPPMVTIGSRSIMGEDTLIIGHSVEGGSVFLGQVIIGEDVTVGVKSVIMPDVKIGNGAIVGALSLVSKGTRICENELWMGIPAKKIRDL